MLNEDIQSTIARVREIALAHAVEEALDKLLPAAKSDIQDALERMQRKRACVAVIGPQGSGKSSLLNSLLFSRRILPMGQGITTNAICYVENAGDDPERTEVVLNTGVMTGPLDIDFLRGFMDEKDNPDNEKGVSELRCFAHSPFLASQTAFVDTPGVGSTKAWHDEKTFAFAKDMALGIGVIRGEQLKESEVGFLKSIWPLSPRYIFVQNVWGEEPDQVARQLEEHRKQLMAIATECGDRKPVLIFAVNIHQGLQGATNNDPELIKKSGLAELRQAIATHTNRGGQWLELQGQVERITAVLRRAARSAERQISVLKSGRDLEALKTEHKRARAELKHLEAEASEAEDDFRKRHKECLSNSKIRFDKEFDRIWREFRQRAERPDEFYVRDFNSALQHSIWEELQQLQSRMSDIETAYIRGAMKRTEAALNLGDPEELAKPDYTGSHVAEWAGNVVVGAGTIGLTSLTATALGTVISTMVAGGTAGAGVAAALAMIPVAGWVIAGSLVAAGAAVRFISRKSRLSEALRNLDRALKSTKENTVTALTEAYEHRRDNLIAAVGGHFRGVVAQQKKEAADLETKMKLSEQGRQQETSDLEQKRQTLAEAIGQLQTITQVRSAAAPA